MNENLYQTPESKLVDKTGNDLLATRWQRLWASLLDSLVMMIVVLPVMFFTGGFNFIFEGTEPVTSYNLLMGAGSIFVFVLFNGNLLANHGQTIGKRALGIKIVDVDGNPATVNQHLLKRYAVFFLPGQIPLVGSIFSTLNILFIFGKEKRCLHDYIANTIVVQVAGFDK